MINGLFFLGLLLALGGTVELLKRSRRANPARRPTPIVLNQPRPCDTTGCSHRGWVPVTRASDGRSVQVCHGCYDLGSLTGRWAA